MIEIIYFCIFSFALLICILSNISILYALLFGFFLFFSYGLLKKHTISEMFMFSFEGIKTIKNILITLILIGILTAVWRVCGTIPFLVYHASEFCTPNGMLLITFLLCCFISVLTGTAFGTVATIGVICMAISNSMGISPLFSGGAILSGIFFGDRSSPLSTSALLVSELTDTDIFKNLTIMIKTAIIPFALSCIFYFVIGLNYNSKSQSNNILQFFSDYFSLHSITILPAAIIIVLSILRINVRTTMSISIITGIFIALFIQNVSPSDLINIILFGFHPEDKSLSSLLSGGGIISMVNVFSIVCLSSCYSGIFNGTGFLNGIKRYIKCLSDKLTPFGSILITSIFTGFISCNQTLAIMLTFELCEHVEKDKYTLASDIENTAVVISPLIPWSIACAMPLSTISAPNTSILFACYLYLLPVCSYIVVILRNKKECVQNGI